jgi:hypothetical protein
VSPDGQRFLMIKETDQNVYAMEIVVVLNWWKSLGMLKRLLSVIAVLGVAAVGVVASRVPRGSDVPAAYRSLYAMLRTELDAWERQLSAGAQAGATRDVRPAQPGARPVWGAELLVANANRGEALLQPNAILGTRLFLGRFKSLGFDAVTISVNYPLLTPRFPRAAEYAAFYRAVAREVRREGLKLEVESGVLFANTAFSSVRYDYGKTSLAEWTAGRKAHVATILKEMAPDWLDLGAEPDTEARLSGKPELNRPRERADMIVAMLNGLDRGQTKIAAGIGTWGDIRFVEQYLARTSLDAIAIHIYPIGLRPLDTAARVARLARTAGKEVLLDEAWLYKAGAGDATEQIASNEAIFKRDIWSFWAPLDQQFLRCLDLFARQEGVGYVSPFWSHTYFAYLDYDPAIDAQAYAAANAKYLESARAAVVGGALSPTGEAVKKLLAR